MIRKVEVHAVDDAHAVGVWGRTLIQIWRGPATQEASAEINAIGMRMIPGSPKATVLWIVEPGSPPPDAGTRSNFAQFSKDIGSRMASVVIVAEGGGFRSALVRSVGLALTRLVPHTKVFQFANDVESAATLLNPHLAPALGGKQALLEAVEDLRSKIGTMTVSGGAAQRRAIS